MKSMRWIKFFDGSRYTFAVDIQKFAEQHGYVVPCEQDGTRHPGTDCNSKLRTAFKNRSMRRVFNLTEQSVVDIRADDSMFNRSFLRWIVDNELVTPYYLQRGVIQLYSIEAVNAILSVMLDTAVSYEEDQDDEGWLCYIFVTKRSHSLEKGKYKPKASLFNK